MRMETKEGLSCKLAGGKASRLRMHKPVERGLSLLVSVPLMRAMAGQSVVARRRTGLEWPGQPENFRSRLGRRLALLRRRATGQFPERRAALTACIPNPSIPRTGKRG